VSRDRFATRAAILHSAAHLISTLGLPQLGVNSLAHAAKCDKVLIYRYFGSLDGVLQALGNERLLWPKIDDVVTRPGEDDTLADAVRTVLLEEWAALSDDALFRASAAAEASVGGPLSAVAAAQRSESHARIIAALKDTHRVPPYIDLPALVELLSAALTLFALRAAHAHGAAPSAAGEAGLQPEAFDPTTPQGWRRIEKMVATITRALLEADGG
jgi:AcrR family transcriptional regulator